MADILLFNDNDSKIVFYILELKLVFKIVLINKLYVIVFIERTGLSLKKNLYQTAVSVQIYVKFEFKGVSFINIWFNSFDKNGFSFKYKYEIL